MKNKRAKRITALALCLSALAAGMTALAAGDVLMINPIDEDPVNHGGAFHFQKGRMVARTPFDTEEILLVEIP